MCSISVQFNSLANFLVLFLVHEEHCIQYGNAYNRTSFHSPTTFEWLPDSPFCFKSLFYCLLSGNLRPINSNRSHIPMEEHSPNHNIVIRPTGWVMGVFCHSLGDLLTYFTKCKAPCSLIWLKLVWYFLLGTYFVTHPSPDFGETAIGCGRVNVNISEF